MLELKSLRAGYGRATVLHDLDLELKAGEVTALLGRNGAGKSTTLKAVVGLVMPTSGEILFEGRRIDGLAPYQIARLGIGYVPEDRRIFTDLTVDENLEVGRRPARAGAPVWTTERVFSLFPDLAAARSRAAARLSGGEQKMLAISRTLMGNPSVLLLDEPSEGLAPLVVEHMARTISGLKRAGLSVLLCEQNLHFARRIADRAYVIETGQVRYAATIGESLSI
jgi:branched-chain amino acid transport system ATP-binding protein